MLVGVTGTPGSGKSHFAKRLAKRVRGSHIIELNAIVEKYGAFSGHDRFGTKIVRMRELEAGLREEMGRNGSAVVIVVGHLIPDMRTKTDICVVVRSGLDRLIRVLKGRGYPTEKIRDNVLAEALDYCGIRETGKARELYEVETENDKKAAVEYIAEVAMGRKTARPRTREITKMGELLELINGRGISRL